MDEGILFVRCPLSICLDILNMLLNPTEMDIQLVQMLQQGSQGCALSHLGKSVNILGEALTTITELTVRAWDIGMGVVDIARK